MEGEARQAVTGPAVQQDDPMLRLQYYRETGQQAEAQQYEQYLRETNQYRDPTPAVSPTTAAIRAAFKNGTLGAQMQAANAADAQDAQGPSYASRFATHLLNTAQGIPGMEALEAGAGALGSKLTAHPMNYRQSLATLRDATGNIGGATSAAEHVMGGLATMPLLPASPAAAGAVLGGADQALNADPDQSLMERAGRTAIGAGAGALIGKTLDNLITTARAKLPSATATSAQNVIRREASRDAAANTGYGAFRKLGDLGSTPELDDILSLPVVRTAINTVKGESPTLAKLPDTDASVLDAVYKRIGSKAFKAVNGAETNEARQALLDAIDKASTAKGVSYGDIVGAYKTASKGINAVQRGSDMVKGAATPLKAGRNLDKTSPEAFAQWAKRASPDELDAAKQGILGALKSSDVLKWHKVLGLPVFPSTTASASGAPGLLRMVDPNAGNAAKYGLLALHSLQ